MNVTKISQKVKYKSFLSIEKNITESRETICYNYKKRYKKN